MDGIQRRDEPGVFLGAESAAEAAEWKESETGREAKFYKLTTKGRKQLKDEATNWARLSEAVELILGLSAGEAQ